MRLIQMIHRVVLIVLLFSTALFACPENTQRIPRSKIYPKDFCIDTYENILLLLGNDNKVIAQHSPYLEPGSKKVRAASLPGVVPQGYITGIESEKACKNAGKRLCSSQEWLAACKSGNPEKIFPYTNQQTAQKGVCNDRRQGRTHPAVELFGPIEYKHHLHDPAINQLQNTVSKTGEFEQCKTPEGVFDLVGNLHEWVADKDGTFRGGYYVDTAQNGDGCNYATVAHGKFYSDYSTGFRCCGDAP